ncbi:sugar phosphate isomerase/epimerase family protein [Acidisoma silvae]|uniref:Sugar phosphate isomerase/epimerase n=1 Tax=Acidisoma silvae TaxID=2802396 RepID=A0A963YVT0_9PROT|nr:sugar phosphate isomerase/epimerase family protein [Acidisoma silvae]MCB8878046.1 sugar phosphate isomerase/epimerase [Acidisoma silvae]
MTMMPPNETSLQSIATAGQSLRTSSAATLAAVDLPLTLPYSPEDWPIGAAMLQFPSVTANGTSIRDAGPDRWRQDFRVIAAEGFTSVEIPSAWLPIGEMTSREHQDLKSVLTEIGLSICATSVVRRSIIDPKDALDNLAATHRAIDAAAAVGSPLVCLGLHEPLSPEQLEVLWFWTVPGATTPNDRAIWKTAAARYRELAQHAAEVGVKISLELYEGTYLGQASDAVEFLHEIDHPNVGFNPDLGNLVRAQEVIEPWESMALKTLPFANYWHVKNYSRAEDPKAGVYLTSPSPMPSGVIDYRKAITFAIAHGFSGAFLCENYGGDGLTVSAGNRRYIQQLLTELQ